MELSTYLCALLHYALKQELIQEETFEDYQEILFSFFNEPVISCSINDEMSYEDIMKYILSIAYQKKMYPLDTIDEMDAFEAKIMDLIMPTPKDVKRLFQQKAKTSSEDATNYLFHVSKAVNYVKTKRLKENVSWETKSTYGKLELTINLAKPEKDPRDIAKALEQENDTSPNIPKCVICKENEQNYHNARMNLRIVPMVLGDELWHFQYSPYQYYDEHAIILHDEHRPMHVYEKTFTYLFDFVDQFPTYFIGSNAGLPIVGGSILNHDHFQGGKYHFPIEQAEVLYQIEKEDAIISLLKWPLSTIRIQSKQREACIKYGTNVLNTWQNYKNEPLDIIPYTQQTPHQAITPIVRMHGSSYELDIILRNNRINDVYPSGIFHPHEDVWHIKKENIGLIEAMGLAILPGRLKNELEAIIHSFDKSDIENPSLAKHQDWIKYLKEKYKTINLDILKDEIGLKFERILEDAGVFKQDLAGIDTFIRFINQV